MTGCPAVEISSERIETESPTGEAQGLDAAVPGDGCGRDGQQMDRGRDPSLAVMDGSMRPPPRVRDMRHLKPAESEEYG